MIIVPRFWRMIIVVIIDAFDLLPESEPGKKNKRCCWAVLVQRNRGSKVICGLSDVVACEAPFFCGSRW